jgi:hypothetical protein
MVKPTFPLRPVLLSAGGFFMLETAIHNLAVFHAAVVPYAPGLANSLTVLLSLATVGLVGGGGYWVWRRSQPNESRSFSKKSGRLVKVTPERVQQELEQTEVLLGRIGNELARRSLRQRVKQIGHELVAEPLNVVIFGTSSTGKTSLVNALLGHRVGDTAPTLGTTTAGVSHTYTLPGEGGTIALTDTPGLQVRGRVGEVEAKELARNGDLLLFAIAADITGHERAELATLADLGKRVILVFNKSDRYLPEEIDDIVASLKRKTRKLLLPQNIVTVAADPVPLKVRRYNTDGSFCETYEDQPPLTEALTGRLVAILQREGSQLRLANAMQKTRRLAEGVAAEIAQSRRLQGERIVQQMQWATAGAVAITPLPALDLLAAAAINARTIGQLHTLYERKISLKRAERTAKVLAKLVLQLGGVEIATQTVGSILKASPLAALGIPLQAVSAAYITRVAGLGYLDWLASETTWDEASMLERLRTQLQTTNRTAFLQQFVRQAVQAAKQRLLPENETALPQTSRRKPRPLPLSNEEPVRLPLLDTVVEASDRQLAAG